MVVVCTVCNGKQFVSQAAYNQHCNTHKNHVRPAAGLATHRCLVCPNRMFSSAPDLLKHCETEHYTCKLCRQFFSTEDALQSHYNNTTTHPKCPYCGRGAFDRHANLMHQQVAHNLIHCAPCERVYTKDGIKAHWRDSTNHPTCRTCNIGFDTSTTYLTHFRASHSDMWCNICSLPFQSQAALIQHYFAAPTHPKCQGCALGFNTQKDLDAHNALKHLPLPPPPPPPQMRIVAPPPPTSYSCDLCVREFKLPFALSAHYKDSPNHPKCQACNIGFKDAAAFAQHVHPKPEPGPSASVAQLPLRPPTRLSHPPSAVPSPPSSPRFSERSPSVQKETLTLQESQPPTPLSPRPSVVQPIVVVRPSTPSDSQSSDLSDASPRSEALELQPTRDVDPVQASPRANSEPAPTLFIPRNERPTLFLGTSGISPVSPAIAEEGTILTQASGPISAVSAQTLTYESAPRSTMSTPELIRSPTSLSESIASDTESDVSRTSTDAVAASPSRASRQSSVRSLRDAAGASATSSRASSRAARSSSRLSTPMSHYNFVSPAAVTGGVGPSRLPQPNRRDRETRSETRLDMLSRPQYDAMSMPAIRRARESSPDRDSHERARSESRLGVRRSSRNSRSSTPQVSQRHIHDFDNTMSVVVETPISPRRLGLEPRPETPLSRTSVTRLKKPQSALPSPPSSSHQSSSRHPSNPSVVAERELTITLPRLANPGTMATMSAYVPEEVVSAGTRSTEDAPTPKAKKVAKLANVPMSAGSATTFTTGPTNGSSWHCRVCLKEPSEPTATMCGHLFCRGCIIQELSRNFQCPVCRKVMLLRLHVDPM